MATRDDNQPRANVLGVPVSAIDLDAAVSTIEQWIADRARHYVCICGAHGIIKCQSDGELRDIHSRAGMVTPDGMPVVWMCRALGYKRTERVYGPDLMRRMTALSAKRGYRQFYYGGGEGLAPLLARKLERQHPGLVVAGTHTPPFRAETEDEDAAVVEYINRVKPDIVWIGLSTTKQERWMASHRARIDAPVMIGVGAAFDFLAGTKAQAPVWMQQRGLEWLYRLGSEPGRLWRRYARIVPAFMFLAGRQLVAGAHRATTLDAGTRSARQAK